jgi:hypothetical protein
MTPDLIAFWLAYACAVIVAALWIYGTAHGARTAQMLAAPDPDEEDSPRATCGGPARGENTNPTETRTA